MSDWFDFLASQGAVFEDGLVVGFGETFADYPQFSQATVLFDLGDKGVLMLEGADSSKFLQGQTTADFDQLDANKPLNGAFCTLQGRVLSNFTAVLPASERILLITAKALIDSTLAEKTKYAAFFKTELSDASEHYRVLGLSGPDSTDILKTQYGSVPEPSHSLTTDTGEIIIAVSASRFILILPVQLAVERWEQFAQQARATGLPYWHLLDIQAGLADVYSETSTAFIPQMLNYHLTDTVSFTKGCYTGQEVVARMYYRGTLKRRLHRLTLATADLPIPGTEINSIDGEKPIGRVVLGAPANVNHCEVLAVLTLTEVPSTETFQLSVNGETINAELLALPYVDVDADVEADGDGDGDTDKADNV